ncbi:MAG: hypothetical protein KGO52_01525 [Nitrospirota bacterium]|nr:hypothetical protein [Nitrospirota bacterium]
MTRSRLIVLLAGGLALLTGLTLWMQNGIEPARTNRQDSLIAPPPGTPSKLVGTSAISHGGPSVPPPARPTDTMTAPSPTP